MKDPDTSLDAALGKTLKAYEIKKSDEEESYEVLTLTFTDDSSVSIRSTDYSGYQSWLVVEPTSADNPSGAGD